MGVVTISSSAARTPLGLNAKFSSHWSALKKPTIVAFKGDKPNNTVVVAPQEQISLATETAKAHQRRIGKTKKSPKRVRAVFTDEASPSTVEVDYNEAAAKLENLYNLRTEPDTCNAEEIDGRIKKVLRRRKKTVDDDQIDTDGVVRNQNKKPKRMSLDKRIALKKNKKEEVVAPTRKKRNVKSRAEKIEELVREYSTSTDLVSLDWKKMKIPPVLPSPEHTWLFKLMQPMKVSNMHMCVCVCVKNISFYLFFSPLMKL